MKAHDKACIERANIIRANCSRRARGLPPLPVPAKPARPMVRLAYDANGDYIGALRDGEAVPPGARIELEPAL